MKPYHALICGLVAALCADVASSSAATISRAQGRAGSVIIDIQGRIAAGDADRFNQLIKAAHDAGKLVASVRLNSSGGRLDEGAKLAFAIRVGRLATVVGPGAVCASACFLAFAAGDPKFAAPGSLIGVHKASEASGLETKTSVAATAAMAGFARELGVPSRIISQMVQTPPARIAWLPARDLQLMGVRTTGNVALPPTPAALAEVNAVGEKPAELKAKVRITTAPEKMVESSAWNDFVEKTIALSARQNGGAAVVIRSCKPDSKQCVMAVSYLLEDGREGLATAFQDGDGNIKRREVCESNAANDVRDCRNWDTAATYRDVKNTKGEWVQSLAGE
jgi:hypothetical protein